MHWYWIFILVPEFNCLFCCFWSNFGQMVYVTQVKSYSFSSSESTFNFMGLWRKSGWSSTLSSVTSDSVTDQTTLSPQYNRFWFLIYAKQNLKWLHLHFCWLNGTLLCKKKIVCKSLIFLANYSSSISTWIWKHIQRWWYYRHHFRFDSMILHFLGWY